MSHNLLVWISDKTSKCHLYSHRGTRMVLIVWVFNGLFATQPNNCTIFPMYLPLCLCFPFWSSAYWQMHRLKKRKMTSQILGIWTLFIFIFFPRVTALPVSSESAVCPSASQPLSALNAVLASHSSDAIYRKVKITEESPAKVVCNYVSGFFSSALIKGETEPIICHSHIISEICLPWFSFLCVKINKVLILHP